MIRKLFFSILSLVISSSLFSQNWDWVRTISGTANDTGYSIDVDSSGYVFMTGRCKQLTTFENGNTPYGPTSIGDRDVYISKYSSNGTLIWAKLAGTEKAPHYDQGYSVKADNQGGCYLTGIFNDTSFFGIDTLFSEGERDAFLAKLNSDGDFLWSRRVGGSSHDYARHVDIDPNGDVLFCGNIIGLTSINGNIVGTNNQPTAYLIKYDSNGNFMDFAHFDTPHKSSFEQFTFDADNNIYLVGKINGYGTINGTTITAANSSTWNDLCIIKLDEQFNVIWGKTAGGNYSDIANCITLKDSTIYIGGSYSSTAIFDTITTTFNSTATGSSSNAHKDLFIAAYNLNGNIKWLKTAGNEGVDEIYGLRISEHDNIYASGFYQDSLTMDNTTIYSQPTITNGIILRLDTLGHLIWHKNLEHTAITRCYQLDIDLNENIFITGDFSGTINFDTITRIGQNRDAFGGKLLQPTYPSYILDSTQIYCLGDTAIIEMTSLTSPVDYEYISSDSHTFWLDSNHIYYLIDDSPTINLTGKIVTSNAYYSDTISLDQTITTAVLPIPNLINDTTLCDTVNDFILTTDDYYINYLWSNNPTNNTNTNLVNTSGTITLSVTDTNTCEGTNEVLINFSPCLSVKENYSNCELNFINSTHSFTNNCPLEITNLYISNLNGKTLYKSNHIKANEQIKITNLSDGIYFIKAHYSDSSVKTKKIMILN